MAVFELGGALAPALPELAIGPWMPAPPDPSGMVAFDAEAGPPESVWRVDLARDDAAGRAALDGGARNVAQTHAVLDDVPRRFDHALAELSVLARPDPPGPTRGDRSGPAVPEPPGRIARALQCVGDLARGRARIETVVEGVLVARSITTLSGDTELWIAPGLSRAGAELHARSVAIALRTRHAWTRILVLVVRLAGRLVALGTTSVVTVVPLVWRFLRDVLREVRAPAAAPG